MELADINRREVLRYLGYKNQEADENVSRIVEDCLELLWKNVSPKYRVREFPLTLGAKDCEKILVFAATLGVGADYLIQKYNRLEMSRAVILQAASAAMIEEYCDQVCEGLKKEYEEKGLYLRPRFSPGYGDFSLSCQSAVLDALDAGKHLGIKLTDSFLMMPSKSVTAVIGVSQKPHRCDVKGCGKTDCLYRR